MLIKQTILVLIADDIKYSFFYDQLSDLHYTTDLIFRHSSTNDSLSIPPGNIGNIIIDASLLVKNGNEQLSTLQKHFEASAVIVLCTEAEKNAVTGLLKEGVQSVLVYGRFDVWQLENAISCATEQKAAAVKMNRENAALTAQINEQQEHLDSLLFSMGYAIWSRRADTLEVIYAYTNNAFYKLYGYTADEMIKDKKLFFNNVHPDDQAAVYDSLKHASENGASEIVFRFAHPGGATKTLKSLIKSKPGTAGQSGTINGITFDITKERELTETIRNTQLNLLATINNTKDGIWCIDTNLQIIFCNKSYQDTVYRLAGIIPKPGDHVLGEWGSESFYNTRKKDYERALQGESFTIFVEEEYSGSFLHTEISSNPIYGDDGKIIGVICIARDISETKNQFVQIQRQNEKLMEIAFIQSHNVRGPVASILGLASLFSHDPHEHKTNIEIIEKIKTAANDLDAIIKEVVGKTNEMDM